MTLGHICDAVHNDWRADFQHLVIHDCISPEKFARLCARGRITADLTCISTATREIRKCAETKHAVEGDDKR